MEIALASLALLLALGAWIRVASLARAVERLERTAREARPAPAPAPPPPVEPADDVRRRLDDLEGRCFALETRPPEPRPAPAPDEEPVPGSVDALRRRLRERGFEEVRVQGEGDLRSPLRVEAVRGGTVYKGRVDPAHTGALEERMKPARRAFP